MAIIEINGGPITHRYLMGKTKDEIATMYMRLLRMTDQDAKDAERYRWLRERDIDTISSGGVFAGLVPENVVINGSDLDAAIDLAMKVPTQTDRDVFTSSDPLHPMCAD